MTVSAGARKRVALYGHFDGTNFGNESALQAMLHHLRRAYPGVQVTCICDGPAAAAAAYGVVAIPISDSLFRSWQPRRKLTRLGRKLCSATINEPYQWVRAFWQLRGVDMLIVPGTGLLTDSYGLLGWGPYNVLKWSVLAKLWGGKLVFASIGAGPLHTRIGRWLVRTALNLADFWSCRDESTMSFLHSIGVPADASRVYPDLAFSLPEAAIPRRVPVPGARPVVGLGVMDDAGTYGGGADTVYANYLETLARFATWLLGQGHDVRLLSGDVSDTHARQALLGKLRGQLAAADAARIDDPPVTSVADVLAQIAASDVVVVTRFHNVLLSLLCGTPVISISFHHKCASLMRAMGVGEYCLDFGTLDFDSLVDRFRRIERAGPGLQPGIRERARQFRSLLDQQYERIFADAPLPGTGATPDRTADRIGRPIDGAEAGQ